MNFNEYQKEAGKTAIYPRVGDNFIYPTLGLAGETGEVVEKVKKLVRGGVEKLQDVPEDKKQEIAKELGDMLWYISQMATEFGMTLQSVAELNIKKLADRMSRGVVHSSGDVR